MRVLIGLTYYRPHYSGLTIYTERLARTLAARGHQVTVLTSRFNEDLPEEETQDGVRIVRCNVRLRLSKGVIMPGMPAKAWQLLKDVDVVNLHLPQFDAFYVALMARLQHKPVLVTYHCDLRLPKGFIHTLANIGSNLVNEITVVASQSIVTNSRDFAEHSALLKRHMNKVNPVLPPVEVPEICDEDLVAFQEKHGIHNGQKIIGISARMATEKGVEYLVEAMPEVLRKFPEARVLYNGQYKNVLGEAAYYARLEPLIRQLGDHWTYLGIIPAKEQAAFFKTCDLTVLPSINSTESYGLVQVESMFNGTPVVASDMPGVRHAVKTTGMGKIVPPRDSARLAEAIIDVLDHPEQFLGDIPVIRMRYANQTVAAAYETIFEEITGA